MPQILETPIAHLLAQLNASASRQITGLAGLPGAGKSTVAARLVADINAATAPDTMVALGMDGFHFSQAQLRQFPNSAAAFARRGAPWTFDVQALLKRLQLLRDGADDAAVLWPGFDHTIGDPVEAAIAIAPTTRLILVEGLYLLHGAPIWASIAQIFDERWFLDVPWPTARERLIARHMKTRNWSRAQAEARIVENDERNADLVWQDRASADWLIG